MPRDVAWQTYVDRKQARHQFLRLRDPAPPKSSQPSQRHDKQCKAGGLRHWLQLDKRALAGTALVVRRLTAGAKWIRTLGAWWGHHFLEAGGGPALAAISLFEIRTWFPAPPPVRAPFALRPRRVWRSTRCRLRSRRHSAVIAGMADRTSSPLRSTVENFTSSSISKIRIALHPGFIDGWQCFSWSTVEI